MWHSLQELGGIHNSHAEKLLAREKKAWEEQAAGSRGARAGSQRRAHRPRRPPAAAAAPRGAPPSRKKRSRPTRPTSRRARCTTCNECTQINDKMFAYDENKQAYIADPNAGTYAQLVEAAESCQVSIIHPGKPRNPTSRGWKNCSSAPKPSPSGVGLQPRGQFV